ncbi:hypothetical protein C8R46DRAFT_1063946 [Mycena filopes]|nr:hypothetical protein C8R46DRAFT_1063946 [Mycena filopes]
MESEFLARLDTNYVPSDEEIQRIRQDIDVAARELRRLQALIDELSDKRDKICDYVDSLKALISLPRRLPSEMVQEIFLACLPTDRNAVMSSLEAPLLLCRICSEWRTIALSTPPLWASLHIPFQFVLADERRMHTLQQWLQRSAACPISLSLIGETYYHVHDRERRPPPSSKSLAAIYKLLTATAGRWRCLELANVTSSALLQLVDVQAPVLEFLKISGDLPRIVGHSDTELLHNPTLALLKGQHLRELHLYSSDATAFKPDVDWAQLTHLSISRLDKNHFEDEVIIPLEFLKRTPRLISFEFGLRIATVGLAPASLLLPFLKKLVLPEPCDSNTLETLLESLEMPNLRHLAVPQDILTTTALGTLSKRSPAVEELHCSLQSLATAAAFFNSVLFSSFFPDLTHLELTDTVNANFVANITDELFFRLTPKPTLPLLFPALQNLVVKDCVPSSLDVLKGFLKQRVELGTPFRRLNISFQTPVDDESSYEQCVAPYRVNGLEISFKFASSWSSQWGWDQYGDDNFIALNPWTGLGPTFT